MTTMRKKIAAGAALLALTTLGGCDWFKPAPPVRTSENATATIEENVVEPPLPSSNGSAPAEVNAAATSELREAPPAPDAQTQDDADAVGMTSHVRRDEPLANSTTP
jgi:hypothetical protein